MDKIISIIKNKWTKRGLSALSVLYLGFLALILWLMFSFYLSPTNDAALFILYVFINFLFGAVMLYTRKQIATRICAAFAPLVVFAIMIVGFGQWFVIVPPLVIAAFVFLAAASDETFKTVVGTIYLLIFVVGALVYITMLSLNLTLQSILSIDCNSSQRSQVYSYSPDNTYRLVQYIDDEKTDRHTVSYYIEKTEDDMHFWFLDCMNFIQSKRILVTAYKENEDYKWVSDSVLNIDGKDRDLKELFKDKKKAEITKITLVSTAITTSINEQTSN